MTNHWVVVTGAKFASKVNIFGGGSHRILLSSDIWDPIRGHISNFTRGLSDLGIVIPR